MPQDEMIWQAVVFGTILLLALGAVLISFIFLYQRKKHRHQQEMIYIEERFTREMLYSKNEIQEQTLQHIASEIHDNFNPTLSVINLNLASVLPQVGGLAKETITDTKLIVKQLMAEMKALSISLNTDHVSRIGFPRALEQYADRLHKTGFYTISLHSSGDQYRLSPNKEIILLRMCQEVMNNVVKHAHANAITIQLVYSPGLFKVMISDNGKGFDHDAVLTNSKNLDSTGLRNLRMRAIAIDATMDITSKMEKGTTVTILITA
jgi:signal transduction histidine kinase